MSTELQTYQGQQVATSGTADVMALIGQMANTPGFNVDAMKELVALKERIDSQERKGRFFDALARVQAKAPRITKNGLMDRGAGKGQIAYAKLEDIDAVMRPIYQPEGFSVTWNSPMIDGKIRVVGHFTAYGHTEEREWWCAPDTSGGKQPPQASGSTVSYGKRYISIGFWNIITEGEDTNGVEPENAPNITQQQADDLQTAIEEVGDVSKFRNHFKINKLTDLKQGKQLKEAYALVESKRKQR